MKRLILVRHGETDHNAQQRTISTTDPLLNRTGRQQAAQVAEALATVSIRAIVTSPRTRCVETATAIASRQRDAPEVVRDERLVELGLGVFEGMSRGEIDAAGLTPTFLAWRQHRPPLYPEGAESFDEAAQRLTSVFDDFAPQDESVTVLVGHSHALRIMIASAVLDVSPDSHRRLFLSHCTITSVIWEGAVPRLEVFNEAPSAFGSMAELQADPDAAAV